VTPRAVLVVLALALAVASAALLEHRRAMRDDLAELTAARRGLVETTSNTRLSTEVDRGRLPLERARSIPAGSAEPHLALQLSDGLLTLERGDVVLRKAQVVADVPRGVRAVERVEPGVVVLSGGIELRPARTGADSTAPPVGVVRVPRADFTAILPNLRPGLRAYFF
jgi:hypothetical protein